MRIAKSGVALAILVFMLILAVIFTPKSAWAQSATTGAIAGAVKDSSGGVMAGVTVEAASPALIEKARVVVTDDHGEYKIVDLRPGIYSVTFSLSGFATIKREGLELNTGITLPIDAELRVGTVAESVTVTTATPVVDVENTNPQNVLTSNEITTVPQGGGIQGYTELTLGATVSGTQDVGGNKGEQIASILIHDSRTNDDDELMDGMSWSSGQSTGGLGQRSIVVNKISVQEVTVSTGAGGADSGHAGANVNIVPRTGGDQFHGAINATGANRSFQSTNLDSALAARGLASGQNIKYTYDLGAGFGGPIIPGKVWFWTGYGQWASQEYAPGNYFNKTQNTLFYTPDLSRPAYTNTWNYAYDLRFDWQASKKNKFSLYQSYEDFCQCYELIDISNIAPEATKNLYNRASFLTQAAWNRVISDRLLVRVGFTAALAPGRVNSYPPNVSPTDVPVVLQNTGYGYHAWLGLSGTTYGHPVYDEMNGMATVAYVTGSHALKAGFTWQWSDQNYDEHANSLPGIGPVSYVFNQLPGAPLPTPVSITEYASPLKFTARAWSDAVYAQDQWTIRRLTLDLGLRFDLERGNSPAQTEAATTFTPAHVFPAVKNIPNWNDISPRVGAAYNLFGNGKTAIKGSLGRFVLGDYTSTTVANTPANTIVTNAKRNWTDTNGNYIPDCNLLSTAADSSHGDVCGALANNGFGGLSTNTTYDPSLLSGWNVRPFNWQADVQFQQELRPGMGVTVSYYRTWYGNFKVTQNTLVPATGYTSYCIKGPIDARVSALNGNTVCGFYDVNPAYFGAVQNLVTKASKFGGQSEVYNGFDAKLNSRFGHGGFLNGGISVGQVVTDDCAIVKNYPNVTSLTGTPTQFCHDAVPWSNDMQVKFAGSYPLPWWGLQTSLVYQNLSGYAFDTSYVATNAQILPSLNRNLSSCGATNPCNTTITLSTALYSPGSQSESRLNQLDLRFTKMFKVKERLQIKANFDIYNIANANTILSENTTYSATTTYLRPTSILGPRMFKFGTNISF